VVGGGNVLPKPCKNGGGIVREEEMSGEYVRGGISRGRMSYTKRNAPRNEAIDVF